MNGKFIKASLLFISASVLFLTGCGPIDVNDAGYAAQIAENGAHNDIMNTDGQDAEAQAPEAAPAKAPAEEGGCPTGGCPTGGCPTGDCENPPDPDTSKTVQMPDQVKAEPTKVIPTGEKQVATDVVDYQTTQHVWQPSERHHTVHKHRNLVRRHFTKVVYHPTTKRINRVIRTGSATDQVMPTEEVVEPTIDYGCPGPEPVAPPRVMVRPILRPVFFGYGHGYRYPYHFRHRF